MPGYSRLPGCGIPCAQSPDNELPDVRVIRLAPNQMTGKLDKSQRASIEVLAPPIPGILHVIIPDAIPFRGYRPNWLTLRHSVGNIDKNYVASAE